MFANASVPHEPLSYGSARASGSGAGSHGFSSIVEAERVHTATRTSCVSVTAGTAPFPPEAWNFPLQTWHTLCRRVRYWTAEQLSLATPLGVGRWSKDRAFTGGAILVPAEASAGPLGSTAQPPLGERQSQRQLARLEVAAWVVGVGLLTFAGAVRVVGDYKSRHREVRRFERARPADIAPAALSSLRLEALSVDQSLWAEGRTQAYARALKEEAPAALAILRIPRHRTGSAHPPRDR